ncbi:uncharacterized protein PgNI_00984 [Pyricularia grisea]|uniref:SnoaL-like domain-containing protein n=1 Tax=Pyricularia grisea TaxID=148305 RepID=A0A6P8BKJ1_PYRGI|nr:uncharacterized protein PgNI_00984 [Pyricularia grisea]TLD17308.1 hypothetical protein PgNI_00984 [Pyricularia grisea]
MSSLEVAQLQETVRKLQQQVTRLSGQVVSLFSDAPDTYVQFLGGRYHKKSGVHRLYVERFGKLFTGGRNGPVHGFLLDHPQLQGVVDVDYDASPPVARGRFRSLMQAGVHVSQAAAHPRGVTQWWEGGLYENEYIKDLEEGGGWRIWRLRYFPFWHADFEHGWAYKVAGFVPFQTVTYPEDEAGPDEVLEEDQRMMWPDTRVVPFHYDHPVTGESVKEENMRAPVYGSGPAEAKPGLKLD